MGAAASVHDENEIITRARAEELAGPEFDEIAWEEAVGTSGTISGREWNRNLASFVDSVRPLTSPMKRAQRPGLNRRELELELWYFSVGALCNPEVNLAQDIQPVTALPASLPKHSLVFTAGDAGVAPVEASPGSPGGGDLGSGLSGAQSITDLDALLGPDHNDDDVHSPGGCESAASELALGATVHGIALKLRVGDLPKVDAFVSTRMGSVELVRTMVRVELYDGAIFGTEVDCWAHVAVPSSSASENISPASEESAKSSEDVEDNIRPSAVDTRSVSRIASQVPDARLIETMVQGCVQLGVKNAYVDKVLRTVSSRPRPIDTGTACILPLSTSAKNVVEDGGAISQLPCWSQSDVRKAAADQEGSGFVTCLNGKVLLCGIGSQRKGDGEGGGVLTEAAVSKLRAVLGGRDAEVWACREWYDPRFGVEDDVSLMEPEQRQALEDLVARSPLGPLLQAIATRSDDAAMQQSTVENRNEKPTSAFSMSVD